LPRWRRWLSKLNWHPVVDLEIKAIEREKQIALLRSDSERIRRETEQLRKENARYAELNARIDALLSSSDTSSTPPPPTPGGSPT
jgi:bifunctional DNA-binding transcriptional regulator/antitoxin component of YhaV-PrlF toxin-antitoxin module